MIRADATVEMGTGHAMRCLALAQAWQDSGGKVAFAVAQSSPAIRERFAAEGVDIADLPATAGTMADASELKKIIRTHQASWVVLDGYQFGADYQQSLKADGVRLLLIDDYGHASRYCADFVLNQNVSARAELYGRRESGTRLLLGPRYAMLRRDFKPWRNFQRQIADHASKVLVTMGGSDPDNVTLKVIEAMATVDEDLEARVVLGGSNPHYDELAQVVRQSKKKIQLVRNLTEIVDLMAWADVAISAAGGTCWEICLLALPTLLLDLAENQTPVAEELQRRGAAVHLGSGTSASPQKIATELVRLLQSKAARTEMSQRARGLVDGRGAERVVAALRGRELRLRRVEPADCRLLWEWANEPAIRAVSFSSEPIPWEGHQIWFQKKLVDPNAVLYLALDGDQFPVGQVRYQIAGTRAVVSINLAPGLAGQGYGSAILPLATEQLFRETAAKTVDAYVKPENEAGLRLFAAKGFRRESDEIISGQSAVHFVLSKNGKP